MSKRRRLEWKRLQSSNALKRSVALYLANEKVKQDTFVKPDTVDVVAFGYKERPLLSYSDKELTKMLDESYGKKLAAVKALKDKLGAPNLYSWQKKIIQERLDGAENELANIELIVSALIEEAFSE